MRINSIKSSLCLLYFLMVSYLCLAQNEEVEVSKIWDAAPHSAFTDLVWFNGQFYCTFREGTGHIPEKDNTGDGQIRVISSKDGRDWQSVVLIEKDNFDLRDPKLSIAPDGKLMLLMCAVDYEYRKVASREPYVSFSDKNGTQFSDPLPIDLDWNKKNKWDWLWRVSWIDGIGYGGIFYEPENAEKSGTTQLSLITTKDGKEYDFLTDLNLEGNPNESAMQVTSDGEILMIVRREGGNKNGLFGRSKMPYTEWTWLEFDMRIGGPEFILLPNEKLVFGTRKYSKDGAKTSVYLGDRKGDMKELVELPSGGDTSYPGMVWKDNKLYMTYYSSHEGKTSIYFAIVDGEKFEN